jgi:hypothetical protein
MPGGRADNHRVEQHGGRRALGAADQHVRGAKAGRHVFRAGPDAPVVEKPGVRVEVGGLAGRGGEWRRCLLRRYQRPVLEWGGPASGFDSRDR